VYHCQCPLSRCSVQQRINFFHDISPEMNSVETVDFQALSEYQSGTGCGNATKRSRSELSDDLGSSNMTDKKILIGSDIVDCKIQLGPSTLSYDLETGLLNGFFNEHPIDLLPPNHRQDTF